VKEAKRLGDRAVEKTVLKYAQQVHEPNPGGRVRISMDGRGRTLDNVFVERLWRTVKY
jgi:hypothetical protein